jgi:hypothetical protein
VGVQDGFIIIVLMIIVSASDRNQTGPTHSPGDKKSLSSTTGGDRGLDSGHVVMTATLDLVLEIPLSRHYMR